MHFTHSMMQQSVCSVHEHILWLSTTLSRADYLIANILSVFNVTLKEGYRCIHTTLYAVQMIFIAKMPDNSEKRYRRTKMKCIINAWPWKMVCVQFVLYLKVPFFSGVDDEIGRCSTFQPAADSLRSYKTRTVSFINDLYCVWATKRMCTGVVC